MRHSDVHEFGSLFSEQTSSFELIEARGSYQQLPDPSPRTSLHPGRHLLTKILKSECDSFPYGGSQHPRQKNMRTRISLLMSTAEWLNLYKRRNFRMQGLGKTGSGGYCVQCVHYLGQQDKKILEDKDHRLALHFRTSVGWSY